MSTHFSPLTNQHRFNEHRFDSRPGQGRTVADRWITVSKNEHVIRLRDGIVDAVLPAGRHRVKRSRVRGTADRFVILPATPNVTVVPGQEIMTADGAVVRASVGAVTRIVEPVAFIESGDAMSQLYLFVQQALRSIVATRSIDQTLEQRQAIDDEMAEALAPMVSELGIEITRIGVRDLVVPGELKRAVAEVVTARLGGQAALERARGETAALRSLANGAQMAADNPALLQLRLIQQMEQSSGNTYVLGSGLPAIEA